MFWLWLIAFVMSMVHGFHFSAKYFEDQIKLNRASIRLLVFMYILVGIPLYSFVPFVLWLLKP